MHPQFTPDQLVRFWALIDITQDCWIWQGCTDRNGYGRFTLGKSRWIYVHRAMLEMVDGPLPDGIWSLHRCDTPPCCRPFHLFRGTRHDNAADMVAKGRQVRGERHGNAKLTPALAQQIRNRCQAGARQKALAAEFGVSQSVISNIHQGLLWQSM